MTMLYSSFCDEFCKIAAEAKGKKRDAIVGAGTAAAGGVVAKKSLPFVLGTKRIYHGTTSPEIAAKIKAEGLLGSKGGGGAAKINPQYIKDSKDFVHVSPRKIVGKMFAGMPTEFVQVPTEVRKAREKLYGGGKITGFTGLAGYGKALDIDKKWKKGHPLRQEQNIGKHLAKKMFNPFDKGVKARLLAADIPMEMWSKFQVDPDMTPFKGGVGKEIAAKGKVNIDPKYIHGGKGRKHLALLKERLKNLPSYARRYPKRFGLGAAAALGGAALMGHGGKKLHEALSK